MLFSLLISILLPKYRVWPPPGNRSWQFYFSWIGYILFFGGGILLGLLDWNSGSLDHWLRFPLGGLLVLGGLGLTSWGIRTISWHDSTGLKGNLARSGPYRFTRNPQYVGDALAMLGWAVFTNSSLVWIVNLVGIACMLVTPFSEEPWLEQQYGEEYSSYRSQVARFWGPAARMDHS